jgi:AraC-like DNA-binding protein/quercetin dioxygenase-like cupin family protein
MPKDVADTPEREPTAVFDHDRAEPVHLLRRTRARGFVVRPHAHPHGQLVWPTQGVLRLAGDDGIWIVPESHAVWIPAGVVHQMVAETDTEIRHLLVHPDRRLRLGRSDPTLCSVVVTTPLLRAAIERMSILEDDPDAADRRRRLGDVVLDEIDDLPEAPFHLPGGRDPRLVRLTRHLGGHPDERRPLSVLASEVGSTTRTLERLFRAETGLTYRQWRSRHRLLGSIERLQRGESTTTVAASLGYAGASAFAAAFRERFGLSPQRYRIDAGRPLGETGRRPRPATVADPA